MSVTHLMVYYVMNPKVTLILILGKLRTCWSVSIGLIIKDLQLPREQVIQSFKWLEDKEVITFKETITYNGNQSDLYSVNQNMVETLLKNIQI